MSSFFVRAFSFFSRRNRSNSASSLDYNLPNKGTSPLKVKADQEASLLRKAATSGPLAFSSKKDEQVKDQQVRSPTGVESSTTDDFQSNFVRECRRSTCSTILIHDDECILCLDEFTIDNPQICTLCSCGENRSKFHYPCLLLWLEKKPVCPTCDSAIFYEEGSYHVTECKSETLSI